MWSSTPGKGRVKEERTSVESFLTIGPQESAPAEEAAVKPEIRVEESDEWYGKFVIEPLPRGFGATIGNPMRRVLLSFIEGVAVTWIKIDGVLHEYSTIPHVREEVLEFLQNVKGIRVRSLTGRSGRMRLEVEGPGEARAGDIMTPADLEVVNPQLHLATLDSQEARLVVEFNVEIGRGYRPVPSGDGFPIGVMPLDAVFTPTRKVNYVVERTRVGQQTDFERLVLEVWTDGSLLPVEVVRQAAAMLTEQFGFFAQVGVKAPEEGKPVWADKVSPEVYNASLDRLELSSRTLNCLKRANLHKVGDVLVLGKDGLLKVRNFGEKSLTELYARLQESGFPTPDELQGEAQ